jgi:hypothetical protein
MSAGASGDPLANLKSHWNALCVRLGVKPKQFAMLCGAMTLAIAVVPIKSALKPARASAAPTAAAAAVQPSASATAASSASPGSAANSSFTGSRSSAASAARPTLSAASIPAELLEPAPEFNLAHLPLRNPFMSLAPATPGAANPGSAMPAPADIRLQATMDSDYAIINGRTLLRGQSMVDGKTGRSWTLIEVASRRVRLSCDGVMYEARIGG